MRGMEGYMRGVNLGGWLSQFDEPTKEHFDSFITQEDIRPIGTEFFIGLFEPALRTVRERDIPLYCGEYGVIDRADREDAVRWLTDIHEVFEKYAIGRALWNYKEKDYGIAGEEARPYLQAIADKL